MTKGSDALLPLAGLFDGATVPRPCGDHSGALEQQHGASHLRLALAAQRWPQNTFSPPGDAVDDDCRIPSHITALQAVEVAQAGPSNDRSEEGWVLGRSQGGSDA
jgi:hypothetical protein